MPRNIEIKAAVADPAALRQRALALSSAPAEHIVQDDTFFALPASDGSPHSRLKLRRFADGRGELISYRRADGTQARGSDYVRVPLPDAHTCELMAEALAHALGVVGRVQKSRWLLRHGRTRIHLDEVRGLGHFMELEVVLPEGEHRGNSDASDASDASAVLEANTLMERLGLASAPRIAGAYLDLLLQPR
jgi:adenylate cyclase class IV